MAISRARFIKRLLGSAAAAVALEKIALAEEHKPEAPPSAHLWKGQIVKVKTKGPITAGDFLQYNQDGTMSVAPMFYRDGKMVSPVPVVALAMTDAFSDNTTYAELQ